MEKIKCPWYSCENYGNYKRCYGTDYWRCNTINRSTSVDGDLEKVVKEEKQNKIVHV